MGDRANIKTADGIYFYTHWAGTNLPNTLASALKRGKDRWDDDIYLNRIIFSEMVKDFLLEDTGYGISARVGDGEDRVLELTEGGVKCNGKSWTFQEFIDDTPTWEDMQA